MTSLKGEKIGFVGAGVVGSVLAISLRRAGYEVIAAASRSEMSAEKLANQVQGCEAVSSAQEVADRAAIVFLTTPDDMIQHVTSRITWQKGQRVLHCSGVESLEALEAAEMSGASIGTFHPLQSFGTVEQGLTALVGTVFGIEASDPQLAEGLAQMARDLGGEPVHISPQDKVLYHVAAVTASGFTVTLMKLAADLWERLGLRSEEALKALLPLLKGTVNSLEVNGLPGALTGPLVRGDVGTIRRHLYALKAKAPDYLPLYCYLGLAQLPMALAKGKLDIAKADEIQALLEEYRSHSPPVMAGRGVSTTSSS